MGEALGENKGSIYYVAISNTKDEPTNSNSEFIKSTIWWFRIKQERNNGTTALVNASIPKLQNTYFAPKLWYKRRYLPENYNTTARLG